LRPSRRRTTTLFRRGLKPLPSSLSSLGRRCPNGAEVTLSGNRSSTTATFAIVDTTGPVLTSNVRDIVPKDAPITFAVGGQDLCCGGGVTLSLSAWAYFINGAGKEVNKTDACLIKIVGPSGGRDSGGVGKLRRSGQMIAGIRRPRNSPRKS